MAKFLTQQQKVITMTMPERLTSAAERPMAPRATQDLSRDPDPSAWGLAGCPQLLPRPRRMPWRPCRPHRHAGAAPACLFCRLSLSPSRHNGRPLHKPLPADSAARAARAGLPAILAACDCQDTLPQAGGSKQHKYMPLTVPASGSLKPGVGRAVLLWGLQGEGPSCLFRLLGLQVSLVLGPHLLSPYSQGLPSPLSLLRTIVIGFRPP